MLLWGTLTKRKLPAVTHAHATMLPLGAIMADTMLPEGTYAVKMPPGGTYVVTSGYEGGHNTNGGY